MHIRPDPLNAVRPPPGTVTTIEVTSALVIAPHFDDEVLGCGGLVTRLTAEGASVRVVFCSDGGGGTTDVPQRRALSVRRRTEARQAAAVLDLAGIDELDLPDGDLAQHVAPMAAGIRRLLLQHRPELVLVPSPLEVSADHRAVFGALHRALEMLRTADDFASSTRVHALQVLLYEVNHPLHPDVLVDVGAKVPLIERAMACYASQQEERDYLRVKLGLLKFRTLTLPPSIEAAEAYRRLSLEDFITRSPARLVADLGGVPDLAHVHEGPLISLIVRTKDRPHLLAQALASVARSTYRRLEVLVVNDGGRVPALPAGYPLPLTLSNLPASRGRAGAANAGVAQAHGGVRRVSRRRRPGRSRALRDPGRPGARRGRSSRLHRRRGRDLRGGRAGGMAVHGAPTSVQPRLRSRAPAVRQLHSVQYRADRAHAARRGRAPRCRLADLRGLGPADPPVRARGISPPRAGHLRVPALPR